MTHATLARRGRNPGFKAHLRQGSIMRGDAEAELREKAEGPGELAAASPDTSADDTSRKNGTRPASIIPAAGLEFLPGQIQRPGNRSGQI